MKKMLTKLDKAKRKMMDVLKDNSGQGAIDTAIICEPFLD